MRAIQVSLQARRDLEEIEEYISKDNPDAASRWLSTLREKCLLLSEQPGIGRNRSDLMANLRGFPVGSYIIFYRAVGSGIQIVRVLHGARDIPELFATE